MTLNMDYLTLETARQKTTFNKLAWATLHGINPNTYRRATNELAAPKNGNGNGHHKAAEMPQDSPAQAEALPPIPPHRPRAPRRMMRVGVFDIECQSFDAIGDDGVFTCGCILPLDSDEIITSRLELSDDNDDRRALADFIGQMWKFDILVGHNINAFDLNWINTRRKVHGMPDLRSWLLFDTYQAARSIAYASGGKSLGNLEDVFGLTGLKTTIRKQTWSGARSRDPERFEGVMAQVIHHCEQDVIGQRELFDVLLPDAMTLATGQFKASKWKLGIPDWDGWLAQWEVAQRKLKAQRAEQAGGGIARQPAIAASPTKG